MSHYPRRHFQQRVADGCSVGAQAGDGYAYAFKLQITGAARAECNCVRGCRVQRACIAHLNHATVDRHTAVKELLPFN